VPLNLPPLLLGAGGRSRRMGQAKHRLEVGGRSLLAWQLERFQAAGGTCAVVVLPEGDSPSMRETGIAGLELVWIAQPDPDTPMGDSLRRAALRVLDMEAPAAWWLPVDTPAPGPEGWLDQLAAMAPGIAAVTPAGGGHPVLLARPLLEMVAVSGPDLRLDHLLAGQAARGRVAQVPARDSERRLNLNTPEDWRNWVRTVEPSQDGA